MTQIITRYWFPLGLCIGLALGFVTGGMLP